MRRYLAGCVLALSVVAGLSVTADAVPPGTAAAIKARLAPFGALCKAGDPCGAPAVAATGTGLAPDKIYGQYCVACHATGVAGAPKFGDAAAWAPRFGQGIAAMLSSALAGKGGMPARGTCVNCTDDEIKATIEYLADNAK